MLDAIETIGYFLVGGILIMVGLIAHDIYRRIR